MYLRMIEERNEAMLEEQYCFRYRGTLYTVPKGFVYNGANIPTWCWSILGLHPFHRKVRRAALLHDYLYGEGKKNVADCMFKRICKLDGCSAIKAHLMYLAVSLFGGSHVEEQEEWLSIK